jgi:Ca-activated chloride channel family protein
MFMKKMIYGGIVIVAIVSFAYLAIFQSDPIGPIDPIGDRVDNWAYSAGAGVMEMAPNLGTGAGAPAATFPPSHTTAPMVPKSRGPAAAELGFSTGGAKDINNFRENIENNFLPIATDITYEGLFYDYYFDTGGQRKCHKLFCPSYRYAVTVDPFSEEEEYYMAVGLNSGMKESDFERKKLNLVVVLDISGSMGSTFDNYYYDQSGNIVPTKDEDVGKSKMKIATESVALLLDHLDEDDRFGIVLFNDGAHLTQPMSRVGDTDMQEIKRQILKISSNGGTTMSAGMQMGTSLFDEFAEADQYEYENRIIFITDAMPNQGETSEQGLLSMTEENANRRIHTTFIGVGVDFNTHLVEYITKIRGANYYSVHSAKQFKERMDEGFDYMVTPLVFNLQLQLDAQGYEIEKVYGSPEANEATGEIMKINTLFPSKTEGGETKGGLVLLKLRKTAPITVLRLKVNFEDRMGNADSDETTIDLEARDAEFFDNTGIRKGVLLSRYADLMKNWVVDERKSQANGEPATPTVTFEAGIVVPEPIGASLGQWERQSTPLRVSGIYKELFREFHVYFKSEMEAIGDDTLSQELDILDKLSKYN